MLCKIFLNGFLAIREIVNRFPRCQQWRVILPANQIIFFAVSCRSSTNNFIHLCCKKKRRSKVKAVKYRLEMQNHVLTSYVSDDAITHFYVFIVRSKNCARNLHVSRVGKLKSTGTHKNPNVAFRVL